MALIGLHTVNNTHTWTAVNPRETQEKVNNDKEKRFGTDDQCVGVVWKI